MDIIAIAVALKKAISQTKDIIASHFVAGTNIEITDNLDGTQTISASGEVSATDEVARQAISDHEADVNNPHSVTKNQIGLGNVDNTSDADKPISTAAQAALNGKQPTINSSNPLSSDLVDDTNSANKFVTAADKTAWNGKQDALTFDSTPTSESTNPVTSGGVYTALAGKQSTIDSSHKLSADFVDDTSATNKFVTAADKTKLEKAVTTDDIGLGTDYLIYNGIRVYISATEPTGIIPDGSIWIGSGAAGVGIFTVTVTADSQDNLTSDKTYSEIMAAYNANQLIFVDWVNNRSTYTLSSADRIPLSEIGNNQTFDFTRSYAGDGEIVVMTISIRDSAIDSIVVTNETVSTV